MVQLKLQLDWDRTSAVVATILNSRSGVKKSQMVLPDKVNPYRTRKKSGGKVRLADMARGFGVK